MGRPQALVSVFGLAFFRRRPLVFNVRWAWSAKKKGYAAGEVLHDMQSAAERAEMAKAKTNNRKTLTARRKQMESKGTFLLDSYIEKKIGNVGSGKAYYQSGR